MVYRPTVTGDLQHTCLDLLCELLTPVGEYQRKLATIRGKRQRRRKASKDAKPPNHELVSTPKLEVLQAVTIGFNSTVRCLESAARATSASTSAHLHIDRQSAGEADDSAAALAAVFVCRSNLPSALCQPIPLLMGAASTGKDSLHAPRLVSLPPEAENRLSVALAQPRVGLVGLRHGAIKAQLLIELVQRQVAVSKSPWPEMSRYIPVKIKESQAVVNRKCTDADRERLSIRA